jgi:hypothetical protein
MTQEQFTSLFRTLLQIAGTWAIARGFTDQGTVDSIIGAALILIPTAWGVWTRRKAGLVASAAALPEVKKVLTTPTIADAVPGTKVTSSY